MLRVNTNEKVTVTFELNGRTVRGEATPRMLLTDFLRGELGQTGTHVGCEHGVCGCCTVRIDGVAARSCLMLAVQAEGRRIDTVEGLAASKDALNALQRAFRKHHALQCGFCTAGILMSFSDYLSRNPNPDEDEVRDVLGGHICRCTGYAGLMKAIMEAAAELRGARTSKGAPAQ
ncbi:MAG: (2Fe-2S)-binding protein [Rhodobiaceae bacterium]|nr:(2Fe-2S)-binding protein [Rhodobiaceae bacterium]MCC0016520.1 (2Fe-2S)-binding protein [Rhodobiaceae bacterium]